MRAPLSILSNINNMKKITIIEGPDGVGKTHLVNRIKERFGDSGKELRLVRCPDNRGGAAIRNVIMSEELGANPSALIFLFLADFVYAFDSIIKPELDNPNVHFLFDRFIPSTCVYQKADIVYINKMMEERFVEFTKAFSKAEYIYLTPSSFSEHKNRLLSKQGDEINHLDPVGDDAIKTQISAYLNFSQKHRAFGLLGSFNAEDIYV